MKRTLLLVCLLAFPVAAQAQVAPRYGPTGKPYYRGPVYIPPRYNTYYGYGGAVVPGVPRDGRGNYVRTDPAGSVYRNWSDSQPAPPPRRQVGYFYYPNYPELMYPRPDVRPQVYVLPPPSLTPYHDPYFEERIWYDDWPDYEYWGW